MEESDYANKIGIEHITVYAFSTENWKRAEEEVSTLMALFQSYLDDYSKRADSENKAGLCKKCQIFWPKLLFSGGKSPSGNEEWYDHAFKTGKGVGNRWKPGVCAA